MARFRMNKAAKEKLMAAIRRRNERLVVKLSNALVLWADDTVGEVRAELIRIKALDTGDLYGSVTRTAPKLTGKRLKITIFSSKEYATIIELGRRPKKGKKPPLQPIIGWAKRKGIVKDLPTNPNLDGPLKKKLMAAYKIRKRAKAGGKKRKKQKKPLDQEVRDFLIVLAIQEAIWKKGIKGRKPFRTIRDKRARTFRKDIVSLVRL